MATGRDNQITKQIGEYLVAAELCRRGFMSTTFTGNVPEFDILAINRMGKTTPIQVKAIMGAGWQLDAERFIEIAFDGEKQTVKRTKKPLYAELVYVFVKLAKADSDERDSYYIMPVQELSKLVSKQYRSYMRRVDGVRPKNPKSTHIALAPKDLKAFSDRWDYITH